jgi:hypothetical protein
MPKTLGCRDRRYHALVDLRLDVLSFCRFTRQFSRSDVPYEIWDGFLQFKQSVRIVFVNCSFHWSPQIMSGGERSGDRGGQMAFEIFLPWNTSLSSVMETRAVFSNTVLLEVAADNFVLI